MGGFFSKKKNKVAPTATTTIPEAGLQANVMYEEANQVVEPAPIAGSQELIRIKYLKDNLEQSERGGLSKSSNSSQYTKLVGVLNNIVGHFSGDVFTDNKKNNLLNLKQVKDLYVELLQTCDSYLDRSSFTAAGKIRRSIVQQIQGQAANDLKWVNNNIDVAAYTKQGDTWESILKEARVRKIEVDSIASLETVGGAASVNYKIKENQGTIEEKLKFFKKEEKFIQRGDASVVNNNAGFYLAEAKQFIIEKFGLLDAGKRGILNELEALVAEKQGSGAVKKEQTDTAEFKPIRKALEQRMWAYQTTDEVFDSMGFGIEGGTKRGDEINITNRNVAMSRMAGLFGIDSLVAKSEIVDIVDRSTGKVQRGNLMEGANGKDMDGLHKEAKEHPDAAPLANKLAPDQLTSALGSSVSGSLMKELTSLQVLDIICGQVDRHMNNVMFSQDDSGKLAHIKGIDNDASFGFNEDIVGTRGGRKDKRAYKLSQQAGSDTKTAELSLPRMDKQLADTIATITPDMIKFQLVGLLTETEIEASIKRLNYMKEAIAKAKIDKPEVFLESDDEWNTQAHNEFMEQSGGEKLINELLLSKELYDRAKEELEMAEKRGDSQDEIKKAQKKVNDLKGDCKRKIHWLEKDIAGENDTSYYAAFIVNFIEELSV